MARSNTCILDDRSVGIAEAVDLLAAAHRDHAEVPDFRCSQCGKPVRPHKASQSSTAHFEHRNQNPYCKLSAKSTPAGFAHKQRASEERCWPICNIRKPKYHFPECLRGQCVPAQFDKWLERKARSLLRRDKNRGNTTATREVYKVAIHGAVIRSAGKDEYTGLQLDWMLISKYNNDQSKQKGRHYKKTLGNLPTVDHIDEGLGAPSFAICSWRVNDAKNDLTLGEFVDLCREVLEHDKKQQPTSSIKR